MSLLDQIGNLLHKENVTGGLDIISALLEQENGVSGLIEKFQASDLAETVESWIGTGENLPISSEQIQTVLGDERIQALAEKLGINTSTVAGTLASLLPQAIDKLTPNGEVSETGDLLQQGLAFLKGKLFS